MRNRTKDGEQEVYQRARSEASYQRSDGCIVTGLVLSIPRMFIGGKGGPKKLVYQPDFCAGNTSSVVPCPALDCPLGRD